MCNLYTNKKSAAEIASHFQATIPSIFNAGEGEVYPGGHGIVVREENGPRILQSMTWGFPLALKSKKTGQPIKPMAVPSADAETLNLASAPAPRTNRRRIPQTETAPGERSSRAGPSPSPIRWTLKSTTTTRAEL